MADPKQLLTDALSTLKQTQTLAKEAKQTELASQLMDARENLLEAREAMSAQDDALRTANERISELENALRFRETLVRNQGVYWTKGDSDPWCPSCFEKDQVAMHMNPTAVLAGRLCVCPRCDYNINLDNVSPPKKWPE